MSLDQLRAFITTADTGSFSAAARRLYRAQSVISQTVNNLEKQLGVALFDRKGRYPQLTSEGNVLLADAREILHRVDKFKARAKGMAAGLEPELSVVVDVLFPVSALTQAAADFAVRFPDTGLRLYVEALGAVMEKISSGQCCIGVAGSLPDVPDGVQTQRLFGMPVVMVAAANHPLAKVVAPVSKAQVAEHTQIILTDRSALSDGRNFGVMSPNTWKLADFEVKRSFLLAGLGWGGMPIAAVADDIAAGRLVQLDIEDEPPGGMILPLFLVYPSAAPPGPAGRWFIERLRDCAQQHDIQI